MTAFAVPGLYDVSGTINGRKFHMGSVQVEEGDFLPVDFRDGSAERVQLMRERVASLDGERVMVAQVVESAELEAVADA